LRMQLEARKRKLSGALGVIRREISRLKHKPLGLYAPIYESHALELDYHVTSIRRILKHIDQLERAERDRVREGRELLTAMPNRGRGFSKPG
jgi:hypothetical protein